MGIAKVIGIIFLIFIIIVGIIGVDLYMTYSSLKDADLSKAVSNPTYDVSSDNRTVTISVDVDLPSGGFIPKGVVIDVTINVAGQTITQTAKISLGESKTINLPYQLSDANIATLASGGSLTVDASAKITPTILGFEVSQLTQNVDLGSQTISV